MSIVLQEKISIRTQTAARESSVESSSLLRAVLLSALLVSAVTSAGVFAARSVGSFEITEDMSMSLAYVGASLCFFSLPFLVALYRKKQQLALLAASFLVFSMVVLAGVIS